MKIDIKNDLAIILKVINKWMNQLWNYIVRLKYFFTQQVVYR